MASRATQSLASQENGSHGLLIEQRGMNHQPRLSRKESDKRTRITTASKITAKNCFKVISTLSLYLLTFTYLIIWIIACENDRCFKTQWKIGNTRYWMTYRVFYTILATVKCFRFRALISFSNNVAFDHNGIRESFFIISSIFHNQC